MHCGLSCLREYTVFNNVDIMENILNLGVTRGHLEVLPGKILRYVVKEQPSVANNLRTSVLLRAKGSIYGYQWPICLLWLESSLVHEKS